MSESIFEILLWYTQPGKTLRGKKIIIREEIDFLGSWSIVYNVINLYEDLKTEKLPSKRVNKSTMLS